LTDRYSERKKNGFSSIAVAVLFEVNVGKVVIRYSLVSIQKLFLNLKSSDSSKQLQKLPCIPTVTENILSKANAWGLFVTLNLIALGSTPQQNEGGSCN